MQLDWCKCWVFGSQKTPFGPWVSENTLAYVHIMKHLYFPAMDDIYNNILKEYAKLLVSSFVAMIARIMQDTVDDCLIADVDHHEKLFPKILCKL